MDKVLPADLSAGVSEEEIQQSRAHSGHRDRHVTEILLIPGDVALQTNTGTGGKLPAGYYLLMRWHANDTGKDDADLRKNWSAARNKR